MDCCPGDALPETLVASITGCPFLDSSTIELTGGPGWSGSTTCFGGLTEPSFSLSLSCGGAGWESFSLNGNTPFTGSCNPLSLNFNLGPVDQEGCCSGGGSDVIVHVTE